MFSNEEKNILIADYGRSGQGWLSYMLCYVLNARYMETYYLLQGKLYGSDDVRKLTSGNLPGREKTRYSMVVKTHEYPAKDFGLTDKVIFLSRDPRDIAVSAHERNKLMEKEGKKKSLKDWFYYNLHHFRSVSFVMTALKWKKHYSAWHSRKDIPFFETSYEKISFDTETALKEILDYLDIKPQEAIIKEAIGLFSFEKMTGKKRAGGKQESFFSKNAVFRKGTVGDYKNNFSKLELKIFESICGKEMAQAGYLNQ